MGCDFKPGDELVCVVADPLPASKEYAATADVLVAGDIYTVEAVYFCYWFDRAVVILSEADNGPPYRGFKDEGFGAWRFRKIERRNDSLSIEAFRTIQDGGFEEPKRKAPAKKREKV